MRGERGKVQEVRPIYQRQPKLSAQRGEKCHANSGKGQNKPIHDCIEIRMRAVRRLDWPQAMWTVRRSGCYYRMFTRSSFNRSRTWSKHTTNCRGGIKWLGIGQGADTVLGDTSRLPKSRTASTRNAALCALMRTRPWAPLSARAGVGAVSGWWWKTLQGSYMVFHLHHRTRFICVRQLHPWGGRN